MRFIIWNCDVDCVGVVYEIFWMGWWFVILDLIWLKNDKGIIFFEGILVLKEFCVEIVCLKSE